MVNGDSTEIPFRVEDGHVYMNKVRVDGDVIVNGAITRQHFDGQWWTQEITATSFETRQALAGTEITPLFQVRIPDNTTPDNPVVLELSGVVDAGGYSGSLTIWVDQFYLGEWHAMGNIGKIYLRGETRDFYLRVADAGHLGFLDTIFSGAPVRLSTSKPAGMTTLQFQSTIFTMRQISR